MLPYRKSNPGPLTYESGALPIALRGPASYSAISKYVAKYSFPSCKNNTCSVAVSNHRNLCPYRVWVHIHVLSSQICL